MASPRRSSQAARRRACLGLPFIMLLPPARAFAQVSVHLDPITVDAAPVAGDQTGTSLGSTTVEVLRRGPTAPASLTSDSARLLTEVPGVAVSEAGAISGLPSIRGLSDDRLRVQVDGVDLMPACPNHMNPALSYIAPSRVARVTVFAGVTPVSVGGDSLGGTVVVRSAEPEFAESGRYLVHADLGSSFRSNGQGLSFHSGGMAAIDWLSIAYDESIARSDNYHAGGAFKPGEPGARGGGTHPRGCGGLVCVRRRPPTLAHRGGALPRAHAPARRGPAGRLQ